MGSVKQVGQNKNLECLCKKEVSEHVANKIHLNMQLWPQAGTPQKDVLYIYFRYIGFESAFSAMKTFVILCLLN